MNKTGSWIIAILIGLVLLGLVLFAPFVFMRRWGTTSWMMGPSGMMGGNFGFNQPFSWLAMGAMWLIPLTIVGLLVVGAIASIISLTRPKETPPPAQSLPAAISTPAPLETPALTCPNCARHVETDWVACPYCGAPLKS